MSYYPLTATPSYPGHTHIEADVTALTTDLGVLTTAVAAREVSANKDAASGYAGLTSTSRVSKGVVTADDLIVDTATKGLIIKDTQGTPHYWRLSVTTLGVLVTTDAGTTLP